jgi:hypothetical protein
MLLWDVNLFPVHKLDEKLLLSLWNCLLNKLTTAFHAWEYTYVKQKLLSGITQAFYGKKTFFFMAVSLKYIIQSLRYKYSVERNSKEVTVRPFAFSNYSVARTLRIIYRNCVGFTNTRIKTRNNSRLTTLISDFSLAMLTGNFVAEQYLVNK